MRLAILVVTSLGLALGASRPAAAQHPAAQPAGPDLRIDAAARSKVIEGSLAALIRYYVAAKKYDALTSARAFAEALTADLQAVSHDKHLRVFFSPEPVPDRKPDAPPPAEVERFRDQMKFWNAG